MLIEFFKNLEYRPDQSKTGTVRASYRAGDQMYNLYAIPGQKPGDKGQIFIQSQEGFDKDLPPVRLSEHQRDSLVNDFTELERVTTNSLLEEIEESEEESGGIDERPSGNPI